VNVCVCSLTCAVFAHIHISDADYLISCVSGVTSGFLRGQL
jgi:hypothetical protein